MRAKLQNLYVKSGESLEAILARIEPMAVIARERDDVEAGRKQIPWYEGLAEDAVGGLGG